MFPMRLGFCGINPILKIMSDALKTGDYVLATKYQDGDPRDHWCVGFYNGQTEHATPRHGIVDSSGKLFRGNGFRRVKRISPERGAWMLKHAEDIELSGKSVWRFARCKMDDEPPTQPTEETRG